jgi:hypothetical protein
MYPFVILGVVSLVVFILLQTISRNDMLHAVVSLTIGVILTYFIVYLRMSDKRRSQRKDSFIFWFDSSY